MDESEKQRKSKIKMYGWIKGKKRKSKIKMYGWTKVKNNKHKKHFT